MRLASFLAFGLGGLLFACGSATNDGAASGGAPGDASGGQASASGGVPGVPSGGATNASGGQAGGGSPNDNGTGGLVASGGSGTGGAPAAGGAGSGGSPGSGGVEASGGASGSGGGDGCPFAGHVEYHLNQPESWPSDVTPLITEAMDAAIEQYNCYADLTKSITVNYNPGVPTAEANVDGVLSFGSNKGYMQVATAMHEVAHTLGVGYYPWAELMEDGRWMGEHVDALMTSLPAEERDPDTYSQRTYITGDSQHFWPYGLNQASEHQSDWSLINHVRIVAAMHLDKQAFLDEGP